MLCPVGHMRVLAKNGAALTLGQSTPDAELHTVIQRVGAAFQLHRATTAHNCSLALLSATDKKSVRVTISAASLRYPIPTVKHQIAGCVTFPRSYSGCRLSVGGATQRGGHGKPLSNFLQHSAYCMCKCIHSPLQVSN